MSDQKSINATSRQFQFYSVSETADILGVSEMTLYRLIKAKQFPAVRVGARLVVPSRYITEMVEAALAQKSVVDPSQWVYARHGDGEV